MSDVSSADRVDEIVEGYFKLREAETDPPSTKEAMLAKLEAFVLEHGTIEHIVRVYMARRNDKEAAKREFDNKVEGANQFLERAEARLARHLRENKVESMRTAAGTAFRKTVTSATVGDKEQFKSWVQANGDDGWAFLDIKANKTAVVTYKEENNGALPAGIKWREEEVVQVRR